MLKTTNKCKVIYMVVTTEQFLEIAIESWSEGDLNPRPMSPVQTV